MNSDLIKALGNRTLDECAHDMRDETRSENDRITDLRILMVKTGEYKQYINEAIKEKPKDPTKPPPQEVIEWFTLNEWKYSSEERTTPL